MSERGYYSETVLRQALDALEQHGSLGKAAIAIGVSKTEVNRRVTEARARNLASAGEKADALRGLHGTEPVLPGFVIKQTSAQLGAEGQVEKQWVQQRPEPGEVYKVPEHLRVKGETAFVDEDGRLKGKWIMAREGVVDQVAVAEAVKAVFTDWQPTFQAPPPAPVGITNKRAFYAVSDAHFGMFSWDKETGENWDLPIARHTFLTTYAELIGMTPATDEAIMLFGGDQQHASNFAGTTERSGNVLDMDGRFPKVMMTLFETVVELIMLARKRHRKVLVRVLRGNHDETAAVALSYFLHAWFRDDDSVEVDLSPSLYWFHRFGNVMLCAVHGHTIKAPKLAGKVAATQPRMWGETVFRYGHYFHEHHDEKVAMDENGLIVEKHAILAPADAYHADGPYASTRNAKSIVYDMETGEAGRSVVNIVPAWAKVAA